MSAILSRPQCVNVINVIKEWCPGCVENLCPVRHQATARTSVVSLSNGQFSLKSGSKYNYFLSRNCSWKCHLLECQACCSVYRECWQVSFDIHVFHGPMIQMFVCIWAMVFCPIFSSGWLKKCNDWKWNVKSLARNKLDTSKWHVSLLG